MTVDKTVGKNLRSLALTTLRSAYRTCRPALGPGTCRFHPSCSEYGYQAVAKYGAVRGTWMAVKRIIRCNPFNPGGYDPVP